MSPKGMLKSSHKSLPPWFMLRHCRCVLVLRHMQYFRVRRADHVMHDDGGVLGGRLEDDEFLMVLALH